MWSNSSKGNGHLRGTSGKGTCPKFHESPPSNAKNDQKEFADDAPLIMAWGVAVQQCKEPKPLVFDLARPGPRLFKNYHQASSSGAVPIPGNIE